MALQKTLMLDYSLLQTGIRRRQQLFADRTALELTSDFEYRQLTIGGGEQIAIAGVSQFFLLKADAALQINLNNTGYITVNDLFVITAAISNLVVFNAGTAAVHCIICNV